MKRRFMAILLASGLMLGLCGCGSSGDSTAAPMPPTPTVESTSTQPVDEVVSKESDAEGYSVDELVNLWSSGILNKQDIESKVATGEISYEIYEEFLNYMSGDEEFDAMQSEETSNFWDYPELNNVTRDMAITDAISFSEGVAWITVNNAHAMLINTSGEVLYYYNSDHMNTVKYSGFFQGVSLFENGATGDTFLIDTSGNVVWSKENGISDIEAIYGVGSVESIEITYPAEFNGYLVETVYVNTFEKTCYLSAIIKPDGTWLFEPLEDNPIRLEKCYCRYSDTDKNPKIDFIIVNLFSGEKLFVEWTAKNQPEAIARWQEEYDRANQDGLLYNNELQGFTDSSGNIVIDCSGYILEPYFTPVFHNGYCVLSIQNADRADYITVIDTDGNQLFAPIKNSDAGDRYGFVSDGYFVMTSKPSNVEKFDPLYYQFRQGGENCYITLEGEIYDYELNHGCIFPFSDGYSLVCTDWYSDEYMFIDTNFNDAFPQSSNGQNNENGKAIEKTYVTMNNFSIEGKWKSVGSYGFGQAQPGAIVAFDGTNCNFFSPSDTYAFYADGNDYRLECTSFMSTSTAAFTVKIIDADHIDVYYGDNITELQRTE